MSFRIDPEFEAAAAPILAELEGVATPSVGDVAGRRRIMEPLLRTLDRMQARPSDVETSDHRCLGANEREIALRWYRKNDVTPPGSAVLYLHGGGMILGSVDAYEGVVSRYVSRTGVPMLSVDYRLAPEHPHPTPVEDCYAALVWLSSHAEEFAFDQRRIAVMGDSAGGGLAAGTSLLARERGGPRLAGQILVYPMLDDRTNTPDPELEPFALWSYDDNVTAWGALLGGVDGGSSVPAAAAPARATDLTGLPPTYLEVGELDIFRDEVIEFGRRLGSAGVSTELHVRRGVPHEFDVIAFDSHVARSAGADRARALRSI